MKKAAILFALLVALSGCGAANPSDSTQSSLSNPQHTSSAGSSENMENSSAVSESAEQAASEAAASEAAEIAASEAAASEAAEKAAYEAAASQAAEKAASEATASEAAEQAASEAAASEAAEKAASEAAMSQAAVKSASETNETGAETETVLVEVEEPVENPTVTGTNFLEKVENLVLRKVNREREEAGLSALSFNEDLRSAARLRSRELYKANKFEHKRPNGDEWYSVLDVDIPVDYYAAGENLCMTEYNDPKNHSGKSATFWVTQWKESKPHYENMMRSEYSHAGVGIYYIKKDGMVHAYATMIFAKL